MNGSQSDDDLQGLRQAFSTATGNPSSTGSCPDPDLLWEGARGQLSAGRTRELVDHTATCPACAEAWRMAFRLQKELAAQTAEESTGALQTPAGRRRRRSWTTLAASVAAVIVAVIGIRYLGPGQTPVPIYRDVDPAAIQSLVPDGRPLPRHNCILNWTPGPQGTHYNIRVATEDFEVVDRARALEEATHQLAPDALVDLPAGTKLFWQVEAILPDGSRKTSETFISVLQ